MDVQDVRRIREGVDDMIAAIDQAAPDMTHEQLVRVGERLEAVGRALASMTTARLVETTAVSDHGHEPRTHRIGKDDR